MRASGRKRHGRVSLKTLKGRGFITASGKPIVSTPLGQSLIDMTPDTLRDPVTTAQWEQRPEAITRGETSSGRLHGTVCSLFLCFWPRPSTSAALQPGAFPLPEVWQCVAPARREKRRRIFLELSDADCRTFLPDEDGKPGNREKGPYPRSIHALSAVAPFTQGNDRGTYWACYNKQGHPDGNNVLLPDDNGTPGQPKEKSPRVVTEFTCPDCGKALLYRQGTSKAGETL